MLKGFGTGLVNVFRANPHWQLWSFQRPIEHEEAVNWVMVFFYAITAGVYEEIIFRGIYTKLFEGYFKQKWLFFSFGALLFASAHWCNGPVNLIHTFAWGMIALVIYFYRRKLLSLMLMHAAYDVVTYGRLTE